MTLPTKSLGIAFVLAVVAASPAVAQTRSVRDTATAYGARLNAKGQPAALNANRVNNRIDNRLDNRLAVRVERYRPDSIDHPTATLTVAPDDGTHVSPVLAPPQPQNEPD